MSNILALENRVCLICNKKHTEGAKWFRTPNRFFPDLTIGHICKIHYRNEYSKKWAHENITGNPIYQRKRRDYQNKKYADDVTFREKKKAREKKGSPLYEAKQQRKKEKSKLEKNIILAKNRNKRYYAKDPLKQKHRTSKYLSTLPYLYSSLVSRCKGKYSAIMTFEHFVEIRSPGICVYCLKPIPPKQVGIDRKDSTLEYPRENCVACCGVCNTVKGKWVTFNEMVMFHKVLRGEIAAPPRAKFSIYATLPLKNNWSYKKRFKRFLDGVCKRGDHNELTFETFVAIVSLPCHYCGGPSARTGYGMDRLVPGKLPGYIEANSVSCCPVCNYIKGPHLTEEEMHIMVSVIAYCRVG
jgi:5-methylcytosine-specific restriction endonuclease McrA